MDKMKAENEKNECLQLRVTKYTSSEDLIQIKSKYMECLEAFRRSILHDPRSALQLFNFINESMPYKVRYGDVKNCHNFAVKHKWFQPMKRKKKTNKAKTVTKECDSSEGEEAYILEVDHDAIKKKAEEEEKKEVIVLEAMSDDQFDDVLRQYRVKYENPPRNASQIEFCKRNRFIFQI